MGTVYVANDRVLNREVAVKVLDVADTHGSPLEHDDAELPAHRRQVIGDCRRRHPRRCCDIGVGRPLTVIVCKIVFRKPSNMASRPVSLA